MTTDDTALSIIYEQADASIRRVRHEDRWFFSVIDVVALLTDAPRPSVYWAIVKSRAKLVSLSLYPTHISRV